MTTLYQTSFDEERTRLSETAKSQARFIEAVARFDKKYSANDMAGGSTESTMSQLREAHKNFEGIGKTGEFTLAKQDGDQIVFLLNHRHHDLTELHPVSIHDDEAEPMRLALQGNSGSLVGLDYRGELVLAAYEPVAELNLGIVAKIDISEIRQPFIRAGLLALVAAIFLIIIGAYLFQRIGNPLLRRIEESEEQTRLMLNSTAEAIYGLDLDGHCTFANEACLRLTGNNSMDDLLGKNIHELIHHTRKDGSHYPLEECKIYKSFLEGKGTQTDDEVFWRSDGTSFAAEYSSFPIKKNGIIIGSVVTFSDISARRHAEEEIRLQSEMMKRMREGVYLIRMDGTIVYTNPEFEKMFGYDLGEMIGQNASMVNFPTAISPEETAKEILDELEKNGIWQGEIQNIKKDGTPFWSYASVVSFNHSSYGKVLVAAHTDITERKDMEQALSESKDKYRLLVENQTDLVVKVDVNGAFQFISPSYCSMFGKTEDELLGHAFMPLVHEDDRESTEAAIKALFHPPHTGYHEQRAMTKDGWKWLGWMDTAVLDDSGNVVAIIGVGRDISERRQIEERLQFTQFAVDHSADMAFWLRSDASFFYVNDAACQRLGYTKEELLGKKAYDLNPGHSYEGWAEHWNEIRSRKSFNFEAVLESKAGQEISVEITVNFIEVGGEEYNCSFVRDITDRKQAELALNAASELTSTIISELNVGTTIYDASGQCSLANEEMARQTGASSRALLLSQNFNTIESWKKSGLYDSALKALNENIRQRRQVDLVTSFGKRVILDCHLVPFNASDETKLLLTTYDISDLRHYEQLMSEYEDKLRMLSSSVEQTREAIAITDRDGTIQYVNPAFAELSGYSEDEAIGQNPRVLKSGKQGHSFYQQMWQVLNRGEAWQGRVVNKKKDGSFYPSLLTISPIKNGADEIVNFVGIQQDLAELENLEEQLHQAQKMEALGTLVGGIAHEFNNSLAGVTGNLYLAKKEAAQLPGVVKKLETVEQLSFASAELIKSLLSFARKGIVQKAPIPLALFLKESIKIQRISLPENIAMTSDIETGTMVVEGDANLLQQILMNLINNARDALQGVSNPSITITSDTFIAGSAFFDTHPECSSKKYARISIRDNGCGIKADELPHIFDPFYTTKEVGQGTGLGLSMAYGSLQTHGGAIAIESVTGIGTLVMVYLPLAESEAVDELIESESAEEDGEAETILLVDDNESILNVGSKILKRLNYNVLTATNGQEAIAVFNANKDLIKLVLTDVIMPVMGGIDAVKKLREIEPELKVIFSTGYDRENMRQSDHMDEETMISKPFKISELSAILRNKLDS